MKVAYLHQYFNTPEMSGGTRSYEMARRLVRDGHEVHMITSDRKGGSRRTEDVEGIHVTWIPVPYSNHMGVLRRIWSFVLFAVMASIEGIKARPTIVFATSTPLTIVFPALATKWVRRVPMVFEVRDLWPEMPIAVGALRNPVLIRIARWMEKLAYNQSKMVITLSPGMKEGVVETGYPEDQVEVIPNSSDIDRFQVDPSAGQEWLNSQSWYRGGPVVLYAGTLGPLNQVVDLVDIAASMATKNPEIDFVVMGHGRTLNTVRRRAKELGILDVNFHLLPPVSKQRVPLAYSAAAVSLSLFQDLKPMERNSANKFFDGLASGTPVAINYGGWHAELLQEWDCGIRISREPNVASEELRVLLERIVETPDLGFKSLKLAREKFDRDKLYIEFERVLARAGDE